MKPRSVRLEKDRPMIVKTASGAELLEVRVVSGTVIVRKIGRRLPVVVT